MLRAAPLLSLLVLITAAAADGVAAQETARPPYRLFDSGRGFTAWTAPGFEQAPVRASEADVVGRFYEKVKSQRAYPSPYRTHYDYIHLDDKVRPVYFLKQQYRGRLLVTEKRARKLPLDGVEISAFQLAPDPEKTTPTTAQEGIAVFFRHQGVYAAFVGLAPKSKFKKARATFRKLAYSIRFTSGAPGNAARPGTTDAAKDPYAGSELRSLPLRSTFRAGLMGGYTAVDTDDCIIAYHPSDRAFMKKVRRDLTLAHTVFRRLFPPPEPVTAVALVHVCRNTQDYYQYGGRPSYAAYWSRVKGRLAVLDAEQDGVGTLRDPSTRAALYREAFRQYLFAFAGDPKPDLWFADGHADYFSGMVLSRQGAAIKSARVHREHAKTLHDAFHDRSCPTLRAFIYLPRSQYVRRLALCRAIAWSFVRFLRHSPAVEKHPAWSKILDTYYRVLSGEHGKRLAAAGDDDKAERRRAASAARDAAHRAAFKDTDLDELGEVWRKYATRIKLPRE